MSTDQKADINKDYDDDVTERNKETISLKDKIVIACRILAEEGHSEGLAGQITVRSTDNPGCFLTLRLGLSFGEITDEDVCLIDSELNVIDSDFKTNPALRFHIWVYKARPEVQALIHTHPVYASALSMTGQRLKAAHMDTAMFYDYCAYLAEWPGVPFSDDEGRIISEALGDKIRMIRLFF